MCCRNHFLSTWKICTDSLNMDMLWPVIVQPGLVLVINLLISDSIPLITLATSIALFFIIRLAKHDLRSQSLYFWIVSSISYTIIVFEFIIVSLSEIEPLENFFLVLFSILSIYFLYLTKTSNIKSSYNTNGELGNGELLVNGNNNSSLCPACGIKINSTNFHCNICQECIPKFDHHSYWLNCCIGKFNLHYYVSGIFFGIFALVYASLLILTTICSPDFKFGILVPEDCTDVGDNIEMCTCLVCGIYCLELAVILLIKLINHLWLISNGVSSFEWRERYKYRWCLVKPITCAKNWINFFRQFRGCTSSRKIKILK